MRVLVTGGAGFIGSHMVDALITGGAEVHVVDDLSTGKRVPAAATFTQADVRYDLAPLLSRRRFDALIHLAARVSVRASLADPLEDASVNVLGTLAALEAAAATGVRRVILASSGGTVYGDNGGLACREDDPLCPSSPYGVAKLALERYAAVYERTRGLEISCLRLANVYGPRQDPHGESGVVARFLGRLLSDRPLEIYGDGRQVRDYLYVGDVVEALLAALSGTPGTYNIGTGVGTDLLELIELLERVAGCRARVELREAILGELRVNVLDPRLARERLGWAPRVSLDQGLTWTAGHVALR